MEQKIKAKQNSKTKQKRRKSGAKNRKQKIKAPKQNGDIVTEKSMIFCYNCSVL